MELANRLSGVGEYYFSKKLAQLENLKNQGHDIINLGIGSPDMPPSPAVIGAMSGAIAKPTGHGYANYKGVKPFLTAVAAWYKRYYGVDIDGEREVLSLYGSKEGLIYLCQAYINEGDRVLVPNPGYPAYAASVKLSGGVCVPYELNEENGYVPDFDNLDPMGVKVMFLNYPHMPTGAQVTASVFEKYVAFARAHGILLVHDNPYSFIRNSKPLSIFTVSGAFDVAIELNSLSKSHNMAGWRVGMMIGREDILSGVLRYKSNLNNSMLEAMQIAAAAALSLGDDWYKSLNEVYAAREKVALKIMDVLGVTCRAHQAGLFLWGRMPENASDCYEFIDGVLQNHDIFITPGSIFGSAGDRYVRISLCADEATLTKALNRLSR